MFKALSLLLLTTISLAENIGGITNTKNMILTNVFPDIGEITK